MEGSAAAAPAGAAARVRALTDDVIRKVRAQSRQRLVLLVIPPLVVLALIVAWFIASAGHVGTDNATVGAARAPISASVRGRVVEVLVRENQIVHRGDVLFRLDPDTPRSNVAEAEANLAAAKLRVDALRAAYNQSVANRRASDANSGNAAN